MRTNTKKKIKGPKTQTKKQNKKQTNNNNKEEPVHSVVVAGESSLGDKRFKFDYKIVNGPSFGSVVITLKKTQKMVSQFGCMAYYKGNVKVTTNSREGIFAGLKRLLLTSSSMFMANYEAKDTTNEICFQSHLPGDILPIVVRKGEKIIISPHSLVCFSDNLTINTKRRLRGILTNEGAFQSEFENKSSTDGIVFLASYGGHRKIEVPKGEEFILDNGLFLCSHTSTKYDVTTLGGVKSTLLSGEGFVMKFTGPCELYTQGRSVHNLIHFFSRHLPAKQ